MTPTWAVVLVGITSGALASLVTALVAASHERAAEFRERMLNAADEFSTAAIVALQQARDVAGKIEDPRTPLRDPGSGFFGAEVSARLDAATQAVTTSLRSKLASIFFSPIRLRRPWPPSG